MKKIVSIFAAALIALSFAACSGSNEPESAFVDLGLPSGTLWKNVNESGYYDFSKALSTFGEQIPTREQWDELLNHCTWTPKGNGYEVSGNGHKIYLPAEGGERYDGGSSSPELGGFYWSTEDHGSAFGYLYFSASDNPQIVYGSRYGKFSVRLVQDVK